MLQDLHELEWRIISPRIPFINIDEAPWGSQYKIRDNVVNVPSYIVTTYTSLHHLPNEDETIRVKFKRHLIYKNHVLSENVRHHPWRPCNKPKNLEHTCWFYHHLWLQYTSWKFYCPTRCPSTNSNKWERYINIYKLSDCSSQTSSLLVTSTSAENTIGQEQTAANAEDTQRFISSLATCGSTNSSGNCHVQEQ